MNNLLRTQLESYEKAGWQIEHERAMECCDLEDWIYYALKMLEVIQNNEQRYLEHLGAQRIEFKKEDVENIDHLYALWYKPCGHLLREIERVEKQGYQIENADKFRIACSTSHIPGFDSETLNQARQSLQTSGGHALSGVLDELRGSPV